MICVSIGKLNFDQYRSMLENIELAEIRLDQNNFSLDQIKDIFSFPVKMIATCRPGNKSINERKKILASAIHAGACFVDIELEAPDSYKKELIKIALQKECKIIVSYHNYKNTPLKEELETIVKKCFNTGADIAKIVCQTHSESENARILSLYEKKYKKGENLVAIGMGKKGKITRIAATLLGAPFTYASLSLGSETASGQLDKKIMEKIFSLLNQKTKGNV